MSHILPSLALDVFSAIRGFRNSPVLTAGILAIVALGSGVNLALFSILNAVILRPLPYPNPQDICQISCISSSLASSSFPREALDTWRERTRVFEQMTLVLKTQLLLEGVEAPEQLSGLMVSEDYFRLFGAQPILGRGLAADDFTPSSPLSAVISYQLWQRRFAGDAGVLGKTLRLQGQSHTVVGVMAPLFFFINSENVFWIPIRHRAVSGDSVYARLKKGTTLVQAREESQEVTLAVEDLFRGRLSNWHWRLNVGLLQDITYGHLRPALLVLMASVAFVLIIACVNISSIQLARCMERSREFALREVLGANRLRIVQQLFIESLILASAGGILGILLAFWAKGLVLKSFPGKTALPRLEQAGIDGSVLVFALLVVLTTSIAVSFLPVLHVSSADLWSALRRSGAGAASSIGARRSRQLFIAVEVAISLALLINASLMTRSFYKLVAVDLGFNPEGIITIRLPLPRQRRDFRSDAYYARILQAVEALPGVREAGISTAVPLREDDHRMSFPDSGGKRIHIQFRSVSMNYFHVMGIRYVSGRHFTESDTLKSPWVTIVNETLATQMWPGQNPIGKTIGRGPTVVGVVDDVRHKGATTLPQPECFFALSQQPPLDVATLVVRTRHDYRSILPSLQRAIREIETEQPAHISTMGQLMSDSVAQPRFYAVTTSGLAFLALMLTLMGIYGVISGDTSHRRHEVAIRMALGENQVRLLIRLGCRSGIVVAAGLALGLLLARLSSMVISSFLYGLSATDAYSYLVSALIILPCSLLGIYLPIHRVLRRDPMHHLHAD
jgi:putative ABC transport system permease protein